MICICYSYKFIIINITFVFVDQDTLQKTNDILGKNIGFFIVNFQAIPILIDLDSPDNNFTTEAGEGEDGNEENDENQADDGKLENSVFSFCFLNVFLLFI